DAVTDGRIASGAIDDPRLPDRSAVVQRIFVRRPLRLGCYVREAVRAGGAPGADLPRVEHDHPPERLRGPPGSAAVHPRGVVAVPRLLRRTGRARRAGETQGRIVRLSGRDAVQGGVCVRRTETS